MKNYLTSFVLFLPIFLFSQDINDLNWVKISESQYMATIFEKSNKILREDDKVIIDYFLINTDKITEVSDLSFSEISQNLRKTQLLGVYKNFDTLTLKKNSQYLIKISEVKQDSIHLKVFLDDYISESDKQIIKADLLESFQLEDITYVSKEDSQKIAEEYLGIPNLFEENIFPASYEFKIIKNSENNFKVKNWTFNNIGEKGVSDIISNIIGEFLLLRIKT